MIDYVLMISDLPQATKPFEIILKLDGLYASCYGAMGIWACESYASTIGFGNSVQNTQGARWFWDTYNKKIQIKMGWFTGETDEDAKTVFDLFVAKDVFRIGDWGRGNFFDNNQHSNNIGWGVTKIASASRRNYPAVANKVGK